MAKRVIRLTEAQLRNIIRNCINEATEIPDKVDEVFREFTDNLSDSEVMYRILCNYDFENDHSDEEKPYSETNRELNLIKMVREELENRGLLSGSGETEEFDDEITIRRVDDEYIARGDFDPRMNNVIARKAMEKRLADTRREWENIKARRRNR